MVQAVIVAAGGGSRLYPITDIVPKTLLPIGNKQLPMAEMIVRHCMEHGINEFVFCLNTETGKQVANYFGDGSRFGIKIVYSYTDEPQGTSGEILVAYKKGFITAPALIYYGDTLCSTNLTKMMSYVPEYSADIVVVVNDLVTMPYGFAQDYDNCAKNIIEKPTIKQMMPKYDEMNYGAIMSVYYVKDERFFKEFCAYGIDISKDILPMMIKCGDKVMIYHDDRPFIDVGNWKNFGDAQKWKN